MTQFSEFDREKIKIRALLLNGLAIVTLAIGFVTIGLGAPELLSQDVDYIKVLGTPFLAFTLCWIFHRSALKTLERLSG